MAQVLPALSFIVNLGPDWIALAVPFLAIVALPCLVDLWFWLKDRR